MQISGTVKTIIYRSEETGFTVLELTDQSGDELTAVGPMPQAAVGERVELTGEWTEHYAYGAQFKAVSCSTLSPATLGAMMAYLSSGMIKGIGESTAENLVATFGMDTLDIMEHHPERLMEVYGIGRVRAHTIAASYMAQKDMKDVMMGLQQYGIPPGQAMKLYKIYGPACLQRIDENPYRLIDDVEGIGFKTADRIARNAGVEPDSPERLRAGLKYTLQWARQEGHTYLPREKLIEVAAGILGAEALPVERELDELIVAQGVDYKLIDNAEACFLPYMYRQEQECAVRLNRLCSPRAAAAYFNADREIARLEDKLGVVLAPQQRQAVKLALKSGLMVITGGPGTGKTTILKFVIALMDQLGEGYELCAPTGRAAKRMSEATGSEARTIHRLLECGYGGEAAFNRHQNNPIEADVVIVDEASMVDVPLMWALLRALPPNARLILVGDADQLPPVGPGNLLRDVIASQVAPVVRLTEIFRQGGRSAIVSNAHRINSGQPPILRGEDEFGFEPIASAEGILRRLAALCSGKVGVLPGDPLKDIQVLSPMKKGALGVKNINLRLQEALNPPAHKKRERKYGDNLFREGDKVMQIKNNYRMGWARRRPGRPEELGEGVYNGDLGTIMAIDPYEQTVEVLFDDERCALYEFSQLEELELAYCISIHKSQGSEFPTVILPLAGGPPMLMTRNLLYTAVTRARSMVYILGHEDCPAQMVANNQVKRRYSALSALMRAQRELLS